MYLMPQPVLFHCSERDFAFGMGCKPDVICLTHQRGSGMAAYMKNPKERPAIEGFHFNARKSNPM